MTQIYVMTIPQSEMSKRELILYLRHRSKRWQFGRETGRNTGYRHYQVRYESSNDNLGTERLYWAGISCELELSNGWSNYELKDGDFYTSEDVYLGKYRFRPLRPFQNRLLRYISTNSDRSIGVVVDHCGGQGKTHFARWCELNGKAVYIEGSGTDEQITRDLFDICENTRIHAVIIDCTRSGNLDKREFWSGIEQIKNGHLADRRYGYRSRWIPPPAVLILSNREPEWSYLSGDRWHKFFLKEGNMYEYYTREGEKVKRVTSLLS